MSVTSDLAELISEQLNVNILVGEIILSFLIFAIVIIAGWIAYYIFERYLTRLAKKTKTTLDDEILRNVKKPIYFFVILIGIYYALDLLTPLKPYSVQLTQIFTVAEILLVALVITRVINVFITWYVEKTTERGKKMSEHLLFIFKKIIHAVIYIFALLFILAAFNIDLSGVVIGLGVGGIAIALALQNVLSDAFSAFSIYFDKPFEIGDYIVVGDHSGTVKKIGIMSTRVQLLQGEELVLSNSVLTTTNVRNFKKMEKRRISFSFGVIYATPTNKLKKIPDIIRDIIDGDKLEYVDRLDRVHFTEFGDFSLNFNIIYYLKTKDYAKYMDTQQEINFAIKEAFEKEGIEMAFPTQTIFINSEKNLM